MSARLFFYGLALWTATTVLLRFAGQYLLRPGHPAETLALFLVSLPLMGWLLRRLCRGFKVRPEEWPAAAVMVLLPTLLLDPFSALFFGAVFPNLAPEMAAAFGAWMLWCCAGGLVGATIGRRSGV